jgi:integrase
MPRRRKGELPGYRHHKPSGLAVVTLPDPTAPRGTRDHYLGAYGSPESHQRYADLTAHLLPSTSPGGPPRPFPVPPRGLTVRQLYEAFLHHAWTYYRRADGSPTGEVGNYRDAFKDLLQRWGTIPADQLTRAHLVAVRDALIARKLARSTINARVNKIRHVYRWACQEEPPLVGDAVTSGLLLLRPLPLGRSLARDSAPVLPVPDLHLALVLPVLPAVIRSMLLLQRLSGMRPREVRTLTPGMVNTEDPQLWIVDFGKLHKTAHHGKPRRVILGQEEIALLSSWVRWEEALVPVFRPQYATPKRKPRKGINPGYTKRAYNRAVERACLRTGIPPWSPGQLRHTTATELRRLYGLEYTAKVLGHSKVETTQVYAETDLQDVMDRKKRSP